MNNNDSNARSTSGSVEQTNVGQSQQEILDYWTPERMRNAKPIMPTLPGTPNSRDYRTPNKPAVPSSSGDARPPQQGQNVEPSMTSGSGTSNAGDYWTPDRMRNAKPIMPTIPNTPNSPNAPDSQESSEGSGSF